MPSARLAEIRDQITDPLDDTSACLLRADMARRELLAELDRLDSWAGLMELLDRHWPAGIFEQGDSPDAARNSTRDTGVRIAALIRWVDRLTTERDTLLDVTPCGACDDTGIMPSERWGRDEDGAPWSDEDQPCPEGCQPTSKLPRLREAIDRLTAERDEATANMQGRSEALAVALRQRVLDVADGMERAAPFGPGLMPFVRQVRAAVDGAADTCTCPSPQACVPCGLPSTPAAAQGPVERVAAGQRIALWVGAQNDVIYLLDGRPCTSGDCPPHEDGPNVVATMAGSTREDQALAEALVAAYNGEGRSADEEVATDA